MRIPNYAAGCLKEANSWKSSLMEALLITAANHCGSRLQVRKVCFGGLQDHPLQVGITGTFHDCERDWSSWTSVTNHVQVDHTDDINTFRFPSLCQSAAAIQSLLLSGEKG